MLGYLRDRGVSEEALARVHAPAGLDLGAVSHEEIAVAILAEIVQEKAAGEIAVGVPAEHAQHGHHGHDTAAATGPSNATRRSTPCAA